MGFFSATCPNCGGKVQLDDTKEKGICENCGTELIIQDEVVKIKLDKSEEVKNMKKTAFLLIQESNYLKAKKILDNALIISPEDGELHFDYLLCDLGVNTLEKLNNVKINFNKNIHYIQAIRYLPEEDAEELKTICNKNITNNEKVNYNNEQLNANETRKLKNFHFTISELHDEDILVSYLVEKEQISSKIKDLEKVLSEIGTFNLPKKRQLKNEISEQKTLFFDNLALAKIYKYEQDVLPLYLKIEELETQFKTLSLLNFTRKKEIKLEIQSIFSKITKSYPKDDYSYIQKRKL